VSAARLQSAAPQYYVLTREGAEPQPVGASNTYATLSRNFIELVTPIRADGEHPIPPDADIVPVTAPAEHLPQVEAGLRQAGDMLGALTARFEGLHILALHTPNVELVDERLTAEGVRHGGMTVTHRQVKTAEGTSVVPVRLVEIDDDPARPGTRLVPEGRIVVAERSDAESVHATAQRDHPNGATDLVEVILCAASDGLADLEQRYRRYLDRPATTDGPMRVFELDDARVTLVADRDLDAILPGEKPPAVPALVAYTVAVRDLPATKRLLQDNGLPVVDTPGGDAFVPSQAALGAAVTFRAST
jgi:hypothetical protein